MLTKTKIALAAALLVGSASAVLANDHDEVGGGQVQTWQDIQRTAQEIQGQIKGQDHAGSAYGSASTTKPSHRHEGTTVEH